MNVVVYVEGPPTAKALEALLRPLLQAAQERSHRFRLLPMRGEAALQESFPRLSAELLEKDPEAWIFVLLDGKARAGDALGRRLRDRFREEADQRKIPEERRHHVRIHVLEVEIEALLLAAPEALRERLGTKDSLEGKWRIPIEHQDAERPPRGIVEELFQQYLGRSYEPVVDAPWILARASLEQVIAACPRRFKPFIIELRTLLEGGEPAREPGGTVEGFMYIHEIVIENVRGFGFGSGERGVKLDLQRPDGSFAGWTVLAGRNGTGKSTFLKAVALAVAGPAMARTLQSNYAGWIRKGAPSGSVQVKLRWGERDRRSDGEVRPGNDVRLGLYWEQPESSNEPAWLDSGAQPKMTPLPGLPPEEERQALEGPWADNPVGWFIAGYGPFRRLGPAVQEDSEPGPLMAARLASLFNEEVHLAEALRWLGRVHAERLVLKDRADKEKQRGGSEQAKQLAAQAAKLDVLEESVLKLLRDGLLPDKAKIIEFDGRDLWIEQAGLRLALREFSDGYRTVTALVFDIMRQMHRCFGEIVVDESEGYPRVKHEGVVLIDEIDVHLHVHWQKKIGSWLKRHFPSIQFIVTTHSPFICQAADPKGLILLPALGDPRHPDPVSEDVYNIVVNGSADDAVMSELFGEERPHSDEAESLREEISALESRLIQGEATKKEKARLKKLSAKLPKTPSADVERALLKLSAQLDAKAGAKR